MRNYLDGTDPQNFTPWPFESAETRIAELEKLNAALVSENKELRDMVERGGLKSDEE